MIVAGTPNQIAWKSAKWIFLDLGFSHKARSCGLLIGDGDPECVKYSEAKHQILKLIGEMRDPVHLVLEAPLSVCFDSNGNPTGRSVEVDGENRRFWYFGAACTVTIAAMYLIREIIDAKPKTSIHLFEGFVSYKKAGSKSDHRGDVSLLRDVVKKPKEFPDSIWPAEKLRLDKKDKILSAFAVAGFDCGVPAVIRPSRALEDGGKRLRTH